MITFRQFLSEARAAPLYHATSYSNVLDILRDGFQPRTLHSTKKIWLKNYEVHFGHGDKEEYAKGVSLTRSFNFAEYWGAAIFEIDQQKLIQRYKVVPYNFFQNMVTNKAERMEFEEFVVTKKNIPFTYVKKVHFKRMDKDYTIVQKAIEEITKKYGSGMIGYYK